MKQLLVPTDFSENAMKAVFYASEIAAKKNAIVHLLHIIAPDSYVSVPFHSQESFMNELRMKHQEELRIIQTSIAENYPNVQTKIAVYDGLVSESITDYAANNQIDLIVMGTTGATGLKEVFMGSVTSKIIAKTTIPVIAIPLQYEMEEPDNLLFTTNHFEENKDVLNPIIDMVQLFNTVLHVVIFADSDTTDAAAYLDQTRNIHHYADFLKTAYPDIALKATLLDGSKFENSIEDYIHTNNVDLLAMVHYPKSLAEQFLKKSRTRQMAFHTKIPLLAIPAK
jgi:nucleotide-binding universal stress UspA family protein